MKPNILSFGETIWDIYDDKSFIGGAGLNFAAHCSKCGANSFLFSAVGNDELGKKTDDIIKVLDINRNLIKHSDKMTGQCIVNLDSNGTPDFKVLQNTAYDNIIISEDDISFINKIGFDALYFGTLIQRAPVSRDSLIKLCKECSFKEIVCDINLRKNCYDTISAKFCLENATILKISEEEEPLLRELNLYHCETNSLECICEAICTEYKQIKYIIFTLGERGSFVYCTENKKYFIEKAKPVKAVSSVGAGDSFIAAWITMYLSGESVEKSTEIATRLSGFVVSKTDAIPDYIFKGGVIYA